MKHLRKYKLFKENSEVSEITKETIKDFFAHSLDLGTQWEIETVYYNIENTRDWANNDFTGNHSTCNPGFQIIICHKFWGTIEISELEKYRLLVNQISEDIERFKSIINPEDMFFDGDESEFRIMVFDSRIKEEK